MTCKRLQTIFSERIRRLPAIDPGKKGNMRDEANLNQLLVLPNQYRAERDEPHGCCYHISNVILFVKQIRKTL